MSSKSTRDYWTLYGHHEVAAARATLVLLIVVGALLVVIVGQYIKMNKLQDANDYLSAHRVMWAYRDSDGAYVSSDVRPQQMVSSFAEQFLFNLYNYDPTTVQKNFDAALKMDDPLKAVADAKATDEQANDVIKQEIISQFVIYKEKDLVEHPDSYVYECLARQRTWTTTTPINDVTYDVVLVLKKVPPTAERRAGLVVESKTMTPVNNQ